jgi:hypothetical protein
MSKMGAEDGKTNLYKNQDGNVCNRMLARFMETSQFKFVVAIEDYPRNVSNCLRGIIGKKRKK